MDRLLNVNPDKMGKNEREAYESTKAFWDLEDGANLGIDWNKLTDEEKEQWKMFSSENMFPSAKLNEAITEELL